MTPKARLIRLTLPIRLATGKITIISALINWRDWGINTSAPDYATPIAGPELFLAVTCDV